MKEPQPLTRDFPDALFNPDFLRLSANWLRTHPWPTQAVTKEKAGLAEKLEKRALRLETGTGR